MTRSHAAIRAKERYSLELSDADLAEISRLCLSGKAMLAEKVVKGKIFILKFHNVTVIPLISEMGAIITFMPITHFCAANFNDRGRRPTFKNKKKPKTTRDRR